VAMRQRTRDKGTAVAQSLLPPGTTIRAYAVGRGHARLSTGAILAGVIFLVGFIIGLLLGYILIPGALLLVYVIYEVRPPRVVVVTDSGLALLTRSFWRSRPGKVLALLPAAPIYPDTGSGSVPLILGPERVTLSRHEFDIVATAAASTPPSGPAPPTPPTPPTPPAPDV